MTDEHDRDGDDPPSSDGTRAAAAERAQDEASQTDAEREGSGAGYLRVVPSPDSAGPKVAADGDDEDPAPASGPRAPRGPGVSVAVIAEMLSRPEVRKQLFARVYKEIKSKYRRQEAEDFVNQICLACLASRTPPGAEGALLGWVQAVATHTLADINRSYFRQKRHGADYDEKKVEERAEGWREDEEAHLAWMITPWAMKAVTGDPEDAETLWIIRYKATTGKPWAALAKERGEQESQLKMRCHRLGIKYRPARNRYLFQMGLLVLVLLVTVVALAAVLRGLVRSRVPAAPPITRDDAPPPREVPDAFLQALPTQPAVPDASSAPPDKGPVVPPDRKPAPNPRPVPPLPTDKGPGREK